MIQLNLVLSPGKALSLPARCHRRLRIRVPLLRNLVRGGHTLKVPLALAVDILDQVRFLGVVVFGTMKLVKIPPQDLLRFYPRQHPFILRALLVDISTTQILHEIPPRTLPSHLQFRFIPRQKLTALNRTPLDNSIQTLQLLQLPQMQLLFLLVADGLYSILAYNIARQDQAC